jgi:hypothetical protein
VAAVAVGLATVCVEFGGCVHFVSPSVWATRPDLTPAGSGRAAIVVGLVFSPIIL